MIRSTLNGNWIKYCSLPFVVVVEMHHTQWRHGIVVQCVVQVRSQHIHPGSDGWIQRPTIFFVFVRVVADELHRKSPETLEDVHHAHTFAFLGTFVMLMLVHFQNDHMGPTIKHKIRTLLPTRRMFNHCVARVVFEPVIVQPTLHKVLLRQTRLVEHVRFAKLTQRVLVQDV